MLYEVITVGNVMIDTLLANRRKAVPAAQLLADAGLDAARIANGYGVVTMHRPSNVDDPAVLTRLISTLHQISRRLPLVFAMHPRTRKNIEAHGLAHLLDSAGFP